MYLWRETLCNCPSWSLVINGLIFLHLHLFFNIQTNSLNFIFGFCIFSPPNVLSNDTNDTNEIVSLSDQLHMYVIHIKFWLLVVWVVTTLMFLFSLGTGSPSRNLFQSLYQHQGGCGPGGRAAQILTGRLLVQSSASPKYHWARC